MRRAIFILLAAFVFSNSAAASTLKFDYMKAVIHHTASHDVSIDEIRRWHVDGNGWDDVGYHYLIRADGTVETGRTAGTFGAHARGRNHYYGIALTGYDAFTAEQLESLLNLLEFLGITQVERHHEECPGPGIPVEDVQAILDAVNGSQK